MEANGLNMMAAPGTLPLRGKADADVCRRLAGPCNCLLCRSHGCRPCVPRAPVPADQPDLSIHRTLDPAGDAP